MSLLNISSIVFDLLLAKTVTDQLRSSIANAGETSLESLRQGDCIKLLNEESQFQVIGIDNKHQKCWVRKWPILPSGSPVFEISPKQISMV